MNYNQNKKIAQITSQTLIIGVDIAKFKHVARTQDFRGIEFGSPCQFENIKEGLKTYYGDLWDMTAGPLDEEFIAKADSQLGSPPVYEVYDPKYKIDIGVPHLAATLNSILHQGSINQVFVDVIKSPAQPATETALYSQGKTAFLGGFRGVSHGELRV